MWHDLHVMMYTKYLLLQFIKDIILENLSEAIACRVSPLRICLQHRHPFDPQQKVPLNCNQCCCGRLLVYKLGDIVLPKVGALRYTVFTPLDKISA